MSFVDFLNEIWHKDINALHANMVLFGGFIIAFGLVSLFVKERLYLTESLVATLAGIAFGPMALKIVLPHLWFPGELFFSFLQEAARLVIALQVMTVGASLSSKYLRKSYPSLLILLGPIMTVMWMVSALCVRYGLGIPWLHSLIIAACVTPTDPVLAHSVIKGKFAERYIPTRMRNLLAVESGANDGLGLPFMMLPIWLLLRKSTGEALQDWLLHTWFWEVFVSSIIGGACGYFAHILMKKSIKLKLIDKESFLVFTIALALFVSGFVSMLASDDLFAVFVSGYFFTWDDHFMEATADSHLNEVIDMLFNITFFVFFGASIPWGSMNHFISWRLFLTATLILLLRRLPIVMALWRWIPELQSSKEAILAGWFGPMGVGAIFFAISARDLLLRNGVKDHAEDIFPLVCFFVLSSILVHGITVPLTNSHLKRRMKRKQLQKKIVSSELGHLTDRIMDELERSKIGHSIPLSPAFDSNEMTVRTVANLQNLSEVSPRPIDETCSINRPGEEDPEEYIYVTDDEGEYELEGGRGESLTDAMFMDGDGEGEGDVELGQTSPSALGPKRRYRKQRVRRNSLEPTKYESMLTEIPDD